MNEFITIREQFYDSMDEVVFLYDRSTDNYVDAAVDELSVHGIECLIRT